LFLEKTLPQPLKKLTRSFFQRPAIDVARDLIGAILVRRVGRRKYRARVVETEAYVGAHDLACHASKGRTKRTEIMFGPGGHAYVYFIYGMYEMFNVVTGVAEDAQAVLIRAAEPLDDWEADLSGPGKLTRAMHITRADNGVDLTGNELYFLKDPAHQPQLKITKRIGIDYAQHWKDELLRFYDDKSEAVSKPRH
jgi:DNA-3-methyladenine glycosylase